MDAASKIKPGTVNCWDRNASLETNETILGMDIEGIFSDDDIAKLVEHVEKFLHKLAKKKRK